ncbi:MAG: hypothetical protein AAB859_01535, partial [Patescibacteria group bacterium]
NWDKPHTQAVVFYTKEIIKATPELDTDCNVLIISAYAHDWGYTDFYKLGSSLTQSEYLEAKKVHMAIGAEKIMNLLACNEFSSLKPEQKSRIIGLIVKTGW